MRTSGNEEVSVVVVDDHPFFRDGVRRGLERSGRVRVVGEAGTGREALDLIRAEKPDVALVDYQMPDLDGLEVVAAVIRDQLDTRIVLLSAVTDPAVVYRAIELGAAGYLPKDATRDEIVAGVTDAARGRTVLPAELAAGLAGQIRARSSNEAPVLSERERQVLQAFSRGLSIGDTAAELFLGVSTVKTYTARLYEKLGVSDRAAAVAAAMRLGLLE